MSVGLKLRSDWRALQFRPLSPPSGFGSFQKHLEASGRRHRGGDLNIYVSLTIPGQEAWLGGKMCP